MGIEPILVSMLSHEPIRRLRPQRPTIPIILVEDRSYPGGWLSPDLGVRNVTRRESFKVVPLRYPNCSANKSASFITKRSRTG